MASNPVSSGLQLQLDSRSLLGFSDGDAIASWSDSSGQGNTAGQPTAGRKPIYKTSVIGSNPVARFAGGDDSMFGSFASWGAGTGFTLFSLVTNFVIGSSADFAGIAVCHAGSGDDFRNNGAIAKSISVGADKNAFSLNHNTSQLQRNAAFSIGTTAPFPVPMLPAVCLVGISATGYIAGLNGVAWAGSASRAIVNAAGYVIGNRYLTGAVQTTFGIALDYGMVCVYDRLLNVSEANSVALWMRSEFGLVTASSNIIVVED